ncbi:MotA/TolQ/ExbB proton channel family protein [Luteolibacter ambystomatis]|uniref:MotA/TolQ/ExbB proton channel family protein n=1 Tax=Luteolibacter ambystomatis TaxID=2824561 RepID=A0A975G5H0_9BACT|nr:MotA/TolQ/ExbB proton channel family protein [Luteolibacter ambystomatis]QUE49464.1 MotA/TolQ/ExbB proton channel family protein [Luteolibacter ambystomatis]
MTIAQTLLAGIPDNAPGGLDALRKFFSEGGFFIYPLVLASVVGVTVIVFKALSLRRSTVVPETLARKIEALDANFDHDGWRVVEGEFQRGQSVLGRLGAVTVRHSGKGQTEITHAVEAAARGEMVNLHSGIQTLDVLIAAAPLLGLLGTVSGLVSVFQGLGDSNDNIAIARGIAEALHTTIFGISIAVVALVAHAWFARRIELMTARLEGVLADLARLCAKPSNS